MSWAGSAQILASAGDCMYIAGYGAETRQWAARFFPATRLENPRYEHPASMTAFLQHSTRWVRDPEAFIHHVSQALDTQAVCRELDDAPWPRRGTASSVLLLLGQGCGHDPQEPCLILNKRSARVRQPGDLCCPGGGMVPWLDRLIARAIRVGMLGRAVSVNHRRLFLNGTSHRMRLLLATGIREAFEEMRLNPFGLRFLGPLPPQSLRMFRRVIYPMVCWVNSQQRFHPNWEVAKVVRIPIRRLFQPQGYARYRLSFSPAVQEHVGRAWDEFPCLIFHHRGSREMLWGATFRIVMAFLERTFGFEPPPPHQLPIVPGLIQGDYLSGGRPPGGPLR